jgi:hypothetical protein
LLLERLDGIVLGRRKRVLERDAWSPEIPPVVVGFAGQPFHPKRGRQFHKRRSAQQNRGFPPEADLASAALARCGGGIESERDDTNPPLVVKQPTFKEIWQAGWLAVVGQEQPVPSAH